MESSFSFDESQSITDNGPTRTLGSGKGSTQTRARDGAVDLGNSWSRDRRLICGRNYTGTTSNVSADVAMAVAIE